MGKAHPDAYFSSKNTQTNMKRLFSVSMEDTGFALKESRGLRRLENEKGNSERKHGRGWNRGHSGDCCAAMSNHEMRIQTYASGIRSTDRVSLGSPCKKDSTKVTMSQHQLSGPKSRTKSRGRCQWLVLQPMGPL